MIKILLACFLIIKVTIGVTAIIIRKTDIVYYVIYNFNYFCFVVMCFFYYNSDNQIDEVDKNNLVNEEQ